MISLLLAPPQLSATFADVDFQEGLGLILFILGLIVHIGFAVAVHSDAKEVQGRVRSANKAMSKRI